MSYNQPPPQPGPYGGGTSGASNPYGQGGAAGEPGYGYPQQGAGQVPPRPGAAPVPPRPGYGHPGQRQPGSYGQPQPPGPYGRPQPPGPYGQPGPQPPYGQQQPPHGQQPIPPQGTGSKNNKTNKKKTGIVIGAVVTIAVIGAGIFFVAGGGFGDDGPHKLTTPETVATEYKRQGPGKDDSNMGSSEKKELRQIPGVSGAHPVQAEYRSSTRKQMMFTGLWGKVEDPEKVVDAMFVVLEKSASEQGDTEPVGSPRTMEPDGLGSAVMKCQKFKVTNNDSSAPVKTVELPVCIWGDSSTVGGLMELDPLAAVAGKADLEKVAETTAKVRGDARVPVEK